VIVELDVPGFDEEELALEVSDHALTIKGDRTVETEENEKTFHLRERLERHFERCFALTPEADLDCVEARFRTGVLEVHVPKSEPIKAHKIPIERT
jgi:HSP20 family protein